MAESHSEFSFIGMSVPPPWVVWIIGLVYYFGYGMKSLQVALGCDVHGPRTLALDGWSIVKHA